MSALGVAGIVAWVVVGVPLAAWAARWSAREYDTGAWLEPTPGVTALIVLLWAPLVALGVLVWAIQRPITRWAFSREGRDQRQA